MKVNISLYIKFLKCQLQEFILFKHGLLLNLLSQSLSFFTMILGIYFLTSNFKSIGIYSYHEILFCYSIVQCSFSLAQCFFRSFDQFPVLIRKGELDRFLVRPKSVIFQVMTYKNDFTRLIKVLLSLVIFTISWGKVTIDWTVFKVIVLIFMVFFGSMLFSLLFIMYATFSIFTVQGLEIFNVLTDGAAEFGKYPVSIYGENILKLTTYVIPYALFQYYPFLYLLGEKHEIIYGIIPVFIIFFSVPVILFWRIGLRHYTSTGN